MRKLILTVSLLASLFMVSCRPTGTLVPAATPIPPSSTPAWPPSPTSTTVITASGIRLTATMGPTCPGPERPGQVCTQPYEGIFAVTRAGTEVARVSTDQNGKATINLPPGEYTLTPKIESRFPTGGITTVTVLSGQYVEVTVELDTGIR